MSDGGMGYGLRDVRRVADVEPRGLRPTRWRTTGSHESRDLVIHASGWVASVREDADGFHFILLECPPPPGFRVKFFRADPSCLGGRWGDGALGAEFAGIGAEHPTPANGEFRFFHLIGGWGGPEADRAREAFRRAIRRAHRWGWPVRVTGACYDPDGEGFYMHDPLNPGAVVEASSMPYTFQSFCVGSGNECPALFSGRARISFLGLLLWIFPFLLVLPVVSVVLFRFFVGFF